MNSEALIEYLRNYQGIDVFNPYFDTCVVHDRDDAPDIRSRNLKMMLDHFIESGVDALWIGRDLGYNGGRRTGLALTDEMHLDFVSNLLGLKLDKATVTPLSKEKTATAVWQKLYGIADRIFLWNVFPFHPHENGKEFTNRKHSLEERAHGVEILKILYTILKPSKIVAIGNDAYDCLNKISEFPKPDKVRHPSYGGENLFSEQINDLYDL